MNTRLVSVITPCYNAGTTIAQTIESVILQSYSNWEMFVIDDCSSDNSADIIKSYVSSDARIRYIKTDKPSGSPSKPRNIGLDYANGDYVAFLDADDIWLPDKLKEQLELAESANVAFIYSDYEKISNEGIRNERFIRMRATSTYWDTLESCSIPCLTVLLRRDIIGNTRFKSIAKEDYAFWLEILRQGNTAFNTGKIHALYRESPRSRSANKFEMFKSQWHILREIEGVKMVVAIYFMILFAVYGFAKYIK